MVTKMSSSGEWLIASTNIPSAAPSTGSLNERTGLLKENGYCFECSRTYRSCECKSCSKCGSPFRKYFGTKLVKGRSHCRICASAVCSTCIVLVKGLQKVCTRCHLKQKEEEIITEKALSAIGEAKFGEDPHSIMANLKTPAQRTEALFDAAKKDLSGNTPLFYAGEAGSLPCIALLVEKGADISARNNDGWSALHAVAWKGSSDHHVDCAEHLLEMGAEVLLESNTGETAADLANRCGGTNNMIQILRAAEIEVTIEILAEKAAILIGSSVPTEKKFGKLINTLLQYCEDYSKSAQPSPLLQKKKSNHLLMPTDHLTKTASLDRTLIEKPALCPKCKGHTRNPSGNSLAVMGTSPAHSSLRQQTDIQPIVRSESPSQFKSQLHSEFMAETKKKELEELNHRLTKERNEWEDRCRKLMLSMANSAKDHEKQISELQAEKERLEQENIEEIAKREATYENKLTKIRMEKEEAIIELTEDMRIREHERRDLLHIQKNYKLTWIPDHIVKECQNINCRLKFSQTTRKHHCRCCGRVFCTNCTPNKIDLNMFSYGKPVRVCKSCYALVDEIVSENG